MEIIIHVHVYCIPVHCLLAHVHCTYTYRYVCWVCHIVRCSLSFWMAIIWKYMCTTHTCWSIPTPEQHKHVDTEWRGHLCTTVFMVDNCCHTPTWSYSCTLYQIYSCMSKWSYVSLRSKPKFAQQGSPGSETTLCYSCGFFWIREGAESADLTDQRQCATFSEDVGRHETWPSLWASLPTCLCACMCAMSHVHIIVIFNKQKSELLALPWCRHIHVHVCVYPVYSCTIATCTYMYLFQ